MVQICVKLWQLLHVKCVSLSDIIIGVSYAYVTSCSNCQVMWQLETRFQWFSFANFSVVPTPAESDMCLPWNSSCWTETGSSYKLVTERDINVTCQRLQHSFRPCLIHFHWYRHRPTSVNSSDCNPGIPGSRIPGSRTIFQSRNPGIQPPSIPGFRDYKNY